MWDLVKFILSVTVQFLFRPVLNGQLISLPSSIANGCQVSRRVLVFTYFGGGIISGVELKPICN